MKKRNNISLIIFVIIAIILSLYRITKVDNNEISWDVLGYYLPLPSTFIHNDPMLTNLDWLKELNKDHKLAGTLYMISSNDTGELMYFFLFGMSFFYFPFFLIGSLAAYIFNYPLDGFSIPYQYSLVIGGIIYTIIGLYFLRKILLYFFSDKISSIVLLTTVFASNYIHHLTLKNLETVNILFMLVSIIVWFTIKWHNKQKLKYLLIISISITLTAMVKPSEILIIIIPLFWNIYSLKTFKEKLSLIWKYKNQFIIAIILSIIIISPQILYWFTKTGRILYDTYKNPGVGLDLSSPHIIEALFSYRKGWLLYTPVMIFYLLGLFVIKKQNIKIFFPITFYFIVSFYIISSWTEWWYGAAFSNRPLITTYPLLSISFGYFLTYINKKNFVIKLLVAILILFFTFLNQFQWWQLKNYILDPYRMTKKYYWTTFLKTSATAKDKQLLLVNRSFSGLSKFNNKQDYYSLTLYSNDFENDKESNICTDSITHNCYFSFNQNREYGLTKKFEYGDLTNKDHLWIVINFDARFYDINIKQYPCIVVAMQRKEGTYAYHTFDIVPDTTTWNNYNFEYLTPEIRSKTDTLELYIWNKSKQKFDIDNYSIQAYRKKNVNY